MFEQASQCGGIHWPGQALAAIGNGAAIIGQIGLATLDALGQGFGLAMGLRNQLVDLGLAHLAQQCFAQAHHRAQGEPVAGQGLVDGQGQFGILVAHVTPQHVVHGGFRRQPGLDQQRADLIIPGQRAGAGGKGNVGRRWHRCLCHHRPRLMLHLIDPPALIDLHRKRRRGRGV